MLAEQFQCPTCGVRVGQTCVQMGTLGKGGMISLAARKKRYPCKSRQRLAAGEAITKRKKRKGAK